jgi:adenosine kinase
MMKIVVTGSIAFDYLMRFPGSFKEHIHPEALEQVSLSFLVEDMTRHWGGNGANIAFTMAKLGFRPNLLGTAGRDFSDYRTWLNDAGVNTETVYQHDDVFTASFFCNTDIENNQLASFYSGAMAKSREHTITDSLGEAPDMVIISPNDPDAMSQLTQECRDKGYKFVYDPSQQIARLSGETLSRDMQGAYMMVVNEYEAHMISDKTGKTLDDMRNDIELLIITHGKEGSKVYTNGDVIEVPAFPVGEIQDPTGAGDAYRAGLLAGILRDIPLQVAGTMGALCATYNLEQIGTQSHHFTIDDFIARYREHFDDEGHLDKLKV